MSSKPAGRRAAPPLWNWSAEPGCAPPPVGRGHCLGFFLLPFQVRDVEPCVGQRRLDLARLQDGQVVRGNRGRCQGGALGQRGLEPQDAPGAALEDGDTTVGEGHVVGGAGVPRQAGDSPPGDYAQGCNEARYPPGKPPRGRRVPAPVLGSFGPTRTRRGCRGSGSGLTTVRGAQLVGGGPGARRNEAFRAVVGQDVDHDNGHVVASALGIGQRDQFLRSLAGVGEARHYRSDLLVGCLPGQAVAAQQVPVPVLGPDVDDVDVHRWLHAEGSGEHVALGVDCRLGSAYLAVVYQFLHETVVGGELVEGLVAQQVKPRVADVCHCQPVGPVVSFDNAQGDQCGTHPEHGAVVPGLLPDRPVGRLSRAPRDSAECCPVASKAAWSALTAVHEATSPAACPPMPSATAYNPGATSIWSWLIGRTRPTSLADPTTSLVTSAAPARSGRLARGPRA